MSEFIQTREQRREALKYIILQLHEGRDPAELKSAFRDILNSAGASEVGALESELIAAGLPEQEVKRLCDVHVAVFQDALAQQQKPEMLPGHPVHTFQMENEAGAVALQAVQVAAGRLRAAQSLADIESAAGELRHKLTALRELEKHYLRKEHLLFPFLEKHGIHGPPKVMWALHDDIRAGWKAVQSLLEAPGDLTTLAGRVDTLLTPLLEKIAGLFHKEENILFPMSLENLKEEEWLAIKQQSDEIGYAFSVRPVSQWPANLRKPAPEQPAIPSMPAPGAASGEAPIRLKVGALLPKQIDLMLNHLPIDITFVDENDVVRYCSQGKDRVFLRPETVIGRNVQNCHPPASVHIVNRILNEFKAGKREVAEFWLNFQGRFVHIRYFPVRDEEGRYIGCLEVSQDVTGIRQLTGERRLLADA